MSRFNDFIKDEPLSPFLPLLHTCEGYDFRDIAKQSCLKTSPCDVFNEDLFYLFYGILGYRTKHNKKVSDPAFMPIVLMLKTDAINEPRRIAPFDTGAYEKYEPPFMHPKMKCIDFLLESNMDMVSKLISKFYKTNKNYWDSKPDKFNIPISQFEVNCYFKLISDKSNNDLDDRIKIIEIQTAKNIELSAKNLELVILPLVFMDDPEFSRPISKWKVEYRTYSIHRGDPAEYLGLLYAEVEKYFKEKKYISGHE